MHINVIITWILGKHLHNFGGPLSNQAKYQRVTFTLWVPIYKKTIKIFQSVSTLMEVLEACLNNLSKVTKLETLKKCWTKNSGLFGWKPYNKNE